MRTPWGHRHDTFTPVPRVQYRIGVPEAGWYAELVNSDAALYGGSDLGMVECALLLEEMGRASYPGPYLPTVLVATAIDRAGTDAQKQHWLPAVCAGRARATAAFLDGELSWAPDAIVTRAEKSGRGWTLSGAKPFVAWAHVADVMLVPARTAEGLTLFLVDPRAGGECLRSLQALAVIDPGRGDHRR